MATDRDRTGINLHRGLWRLWLVGTVVWLLAVVVLNAEAVSFWAGYHYSLISKHGSLAGAMAEKEKMKGIVGACQAAERTTCVGLPAPAGRPYVNEYDRLIAERQACVESPKFFEAFVHEASTRGVANAFSIKKAEPCIDLSSLTIPEINWLLLSAVFLVPAFPLLLYAIGAWVAKGFTKHAH